MKRARKEAGKKLLDFMRSWNKWQRQNFASWLDIIFGRSAQLRQDLGRKSRGKYLRHIGRTSICEMHRRVGNPTKLPGKCNLLEHRAKLVSCCCCCRCCCCCCLCPPTAFALEVIFVHSSLRLNCHKGPFTHTHAHTCTQCDCVGQVEMSLRGEVSIFEQISLFSTDDYDGTVRLAVYLRVSPGMG